MAKERALRSRATEGVTNWYCRACTWSVTVFDGKPGQPTIQQVRSEFDSHVCSDRYSEHEGE
jgi:hypothetical protein